MQSSDFNAWVAVSVNGLGHILDDQNGQLWIKIDGAAAYLLPQTKEQWNGLPVYERIGSYTKSKCVLITHNDQLPYKPVSRLSYLQSLKQKIETDKQEQINVLNKIPVKTEAEEEAAKQRGMQNATYGAAANRIEERKANYLKNYKTDKQQREESRQTTAKYFDDKLKIIDDILKNFGNDYLQQPAIIDNNSNFKGFATLENGGRMIVVIDPGYFNSQLPRYMPQLFVLYWQWDKSPASQNIKKLVEENFSIDKLKAMLDK